MRRGQAVHLHATSQPGIRHVDEQVQSVHRGTRQPVGQVAQRGGGHVGRHEVRWSFHLFESAGIGGRPGIAERREEPGHPRQGPPGRRNVSSRPDQVLQRDSAGTGEPPRLATQGPEPCGSHQTVSGRAVRVEQALHRPPWQSPPAELHGPGRGRVRQHEVHEVPVCRGRQRLVRQVHRRRIGQPARPPGGDPFRRREHGRRVVHQVACGHREPEGRAMGQGDDQRTGRGTDPAPDWFRGGDHRPATGHRLPEVGRRIHHGVAAGFPIHDQRRLAVHQHATAVHRDAAYRSTLGGLDCHRHGDRNRGLVDQLDDNSRT